MWYENYVKVPWHTVGNRICWEVRTMAKQPHDDGHYEFRICKRWWRVSFTPDGRGKWILSATSGSTRLYFEGVCRGRRVVLPPLLLDMNRQRMGTGHEKARQMFENQLKSMNGSSTRWFWSAIKNVQMNDETWYVQHVWRMTVTDTGIKQECWTAKHQFSELVTAQLQMNKIDPTIVPYTITAWGTWGNKTYI